jgi:elongator complex protein 1
MVANIPPPMALHEISVSSNAIDVAFNGSSSIAVLHHEGISLFEYKSSLASGQPPMLKGQFTIDKAESSENFYQGICFSENTEVLMLQRYITGSIITRLGFNGDSGTMEEKPSSGPTSLISTLSNFTDDGLVKPFALEVSGNLHSLLPGSESLVYGKLPANLPWVEVVPNGDSHIVFGMSSNGHLYANSRLLVKNCTSFLVTPAHLIFTTTSHLIKFVHITDVNSMLTSSNASRSHANSQKILRFHQMTQKMMRDVAVSNVELDLLLLCQHLLVLYSRCLGAILRLSTLVQWLFPAFGSLSRIRITRKLSQIAGLKELT